MNWYPCWWGFLSYRMLNFVKCFFCIYWDNHAVSVFPFAHVVYHYDSFAYIEQFLQPWNHNLIMVYEPTLYCLIQPATILLKVFCISIHQRWMACVCVCVLSPFSSVQFCMTLWTVAHQAPWFTGFSMQEHWSGFHALLQGIFLTKDWTHVSYISWTGK